MSRRGSQKVKSLATLVISKEMFANQYSFIRAALLLVHINPRRISPVVFIVHSIAKYISVWHLQRYIIRRNGRCKLSRFFLTQHRNFHIGSARGPTMLGDRSQGNSAVENIVHQNYMSPLQRYLRMSLPDKFATL